MRVNSLLLAARAFFLALIAVAPALPAAAAGKRYADFLEPASIALVALAALALLFGARVGQALSRQLMLPTLLALATFGLALRAAPAQALELSSLGALCVSAVLAALGSLQQLGPAAPFRFTGRVVAVTALGALGIVLLLPLGLGRDPGTKFAGAIGVGCIGSLILAAARFEATFATRRFPEVRLRTSGLLLGTWLGLAALAAASLGAALLSLRAGGSDAAQALPWLDARQSAHVSWATALPITAALCAVFVGRSALTGLNAQRARELGWVVVALALPSLLAFGSLRRVRELAPVAAAPLPVALARATHGSASEPRLPEPSPAAVPELPKSPEPPASAAEPSVPNSPEPEANGEVGVEVSGAEGVYDEDARRSILRRIDRARDCIRRNPSAHGILSARVVVDGDGSVTNVVPLSGDLLGSDFSKCAMLWLYRVGFAPPRARETAKFEVTLHFPGGRR
jgi:hypothetical protein